MRFERFGDLKPARQEGFRQTYDKDYSVWHEPPARYGFYALPFGCRDGWIIPKKRERIILLRDEKGKLIEDDGNRERKIKEWDGPLTEYGRKVLKRYHATSDRLLCYRAYPFVRIMKDWRHPPSLLPSGMLDQELGYLYDGCGGKVTADKVFKNRDWSLDDYRWRGRRAHWQYVVPDDVDKFAPMEWFVKRGLDIRQLCVWPLRPQDDGCFWGIWKRPRVFEYRGMLWHHLGSYLRSGELQGTYQGAWFRSSVADFEKALRRYDMSYRMERAEWLNETSERWKERTFDLSGRVMMQKIWSRIQKLKSSPIRGTPGPKWDLDGPDGDGELEVFIEQSDWAARNRGRI